MDAIEQGRRKQTSSSVDAFGASPTLDDPSSRSRSVSGAVRVPHAKSGEEADLSEQKKNESGIAYWLKLLAAVGIPLALMYLAIAGLFNTQFAEIREALSEIREDISENRDLISSNREAIAANSSSIERLAAKVDSSIARLEGKVDSSIARLEGKVDSSIARLEGKVDSSIARLEARIDLVIEVLILAFTNENITEAELRSILSAGEE